MTELPELSAAGLAFLHKEEGWAGKPYWPGTASGITLDPGDDLGYRSPASFIKDWREHLPVADFQRLLKVVGLRGERAKAALPSLAGIVIPRAAADRVFDEALEPRYAQMTLDAFPGADELGDAARSGDDAWAGLFSLVYNRGPKVPDVFMDPRREEMAHIREAVRVRNHMWIADLLVIMARVWENTPTKQDDGLIGRREREAVLVEPTVVSRLPELRKLRRAA